MAKIYYNKDADIEVIKKKTVAIIGYGSQGHAHARNLHDSGIKVVVGLRKKSSFWKRAEKDGLKVMTVPEATKIADAARNRGISIMIGCMVGTSLGMAPAFLLGAYAQIVDLDGPLFLAEDRPGGIQYDGGIMQPPQSDFWG